MTTPTMTANMYMYIPVLVLKSRLLYGLAVCLIGIPLGNFYIVQIFTVFTDTSTTTKIRTTKI